MNARTVFDRPGMSAAFSLPPRLFAGRVFDRGRGASDARSKSAQNGGTDILLVCVAGSHTTGRNACAPVLRTSAPRLRTSLAPLPRPLPGGPGRGRREESARARGITGANSRAGIRVADFPREESRGIACGRSRAAEVVRQRPRISARRPLGASPAPAGTR
jgi:hypothetical protein